MFVLWFVSHQYGWTFIHSDNWKCVVEAVESATMRGRVHRNHGSKSLKLKFLAMLILTFVDAPHVSKAVECSLHQTSMVDILFWISNKMFIKKNTFFSYAFDTFGSIYGNESVVELDGSATLPMWVAPMESSLTAGRGGKGKTQMLADVYYIQKYLCAHIAHRPFDCVGGTSKLIYNNFMICASIVIAWWMCSQYIRLTAIYVAIRALCWCLVLFGLFTFQLILKSWCDKMNEIAS